MQEVQEPAHAAGTFDFEVFGSGRAGRYQSSRFQVRCDAIGLHDNEILLLSVVGAETSVKALMAGLRSSGRDQKRIAYSANVGTIHGINLTKSADGYRVYRTKLNYGLWHVLCLAKREGFMPVMTEATLWQHLQGVLDVASVWSTINVSHYASANLQRTEGQGQVSGSHGPSANGC